MGERFYFNFARLKSSEKIQSSFFILRFYIVTCRGVACRTSVLGRVGVGLGFLGWGYCFQLAAIVSTINCCDFSTELGCLVTERVAILAEELGVGVFLGVGSGSGSGSGVACWARTASGSGSGSGSLRLIPA